MGFEIDAFDGALPLIIDPLVSYSNYLGGAAQSAVTGVAVDSAAICTLRAGPKRSISRLWAPTKGQITAAQTRL